MSFAIHQELGRALVCLFHSCPLFPFSGLALYLLFCQKALQIPHNPSYPTWLLRAYLVAVPPVVSAAHVHESILRKCLWDERTRTPRFPLSYKQIPLPTDPGKPLHPASVLTCPSRGYSSHREGPGIPPQNSAQGLQTPAELCELPPTRPGQHPQSVAHAWAPGSPAVPWTHEGL